MSGSATSFSEQEMIRIQGLPIILMAGKRITLSTQTTSGFNVVISDSEEPDEQVKSAVAFLKRHRQDLLRLMKCRGIHVAIDFACAQKEYFARSAHLPTALLVTSDNLFAGGTRV